MLSSPSREWSVSGRSRQVNCDSEYMISTILVSIHKKSHSIKKLLYSNCVFCYWLLVYSSLENRALKVQGKEKGAPSLRTAAQRPCRGKRLRNYMYSEWSPQASVVFALSATFLKTVTSLSPPPGSVVDPWNCITFLFSLCTATAPVSHHLLLYDTLFLFNWGKAPQLSLSQSCLQIWL